MCFSTRQLQLLEHSYNSSCHSCTIPTCGWDGNVSCAVHGLFKVCCREGPRLPLLKETFPVIFSCRQTFKKNNHLRDCFFFLKSSSVQRHPAETDSLLFCYGDQVSTFQASFVLIWFLDETSSHKLPSIIIPAGDFPCT